MRISPENLPPEGQPYGQPQHMPTRMGHAHFWQRALSRRQVIVAGAGGAAAATLLSSRLLLPTVAHAAKLVPSDPKPIPLTLGPFHVQLLGPGQEPSTITDFNGFVGVADVQGTGIGTGTGAGALLFDTDMRFMTGEYVGVDGKHYHSTFGFVWLDLYRGQYDFINNSTQEHDFNLGIHPYPSGLFWTMRIPDESVDINLGEGTASMRVEHQAALDFGSIPNAINNGSSFASTVSYEIKWSGILQRTQVHDASKGFSGLFLQTNATIDWKASNANGFAYESDDKGQTTAFAEIGRERNGVFFE